VKLEVKIVTNLWVCIAFVVTGCGTGGIMINYHYRFFRISPERRADLGVSAMEIPEGFNIT